jgi:hypothetical protein
MKYILLFLLVAAVNTTKAQSRQFNIGDTLDCGIVFHIEKDTFNRQHLLICSMNDQSSSITWYNGQYIKTQATSDKLYDISNANAVFNAQGNGSYAAALCRNFSLNDSTCLIKDTLWYLPSVTELKLIYQVLDSSGRLSFTKEGYWSSVEFSDQRSGQRATEKQAFIVDFFSGRSFPTDKSNKYHIRAIREEFR